MFPLRAEGEEDFGAHVEEAMFDEGGTLFDAENEPAVLEAVGARLRHLQRL